MEESVESWFAREILAHEDALVRYLRRCWPHPDDILDLRQETYIRVYEAARRQRPYQPKSFLFTAARHLMADRLRRGRVVSIEAVGDFESLNVPVDEAGPERRHDARQSLRRLAEAFDRLPGRCREVMWLRKVEELPQKEVARRMGVAEKTVEKQVAKGARLIADYMFGEAGARPGKKQRARLESGRDDGQEHG
jgi:RNA polymerase sigma-70 factor (ECF subfamily)